MEGWWAVTRMVALDVPRSAGCDHLLPGQLHERLVAGEWVVDLRDRGSYAATHLAGTIYLGLDGDPAPLLAALMPPGTPLTLLGADLAQIDAAQRRLALGGVPRAETCATGGPLRWVTGGGRLARLAVGTFADLATAARRRPVVALDVRPRGDRSSGGPIWARPIPLEELPSRFGEVPHGEVWVYCADGYRATVAASLLAALGGRTPVVVDDRLGRWPGTGR